MSGPLFGRNGVYLGLVQIIGSIPSETMLHFDLHGFADGFFCRFVTRGGVSDPSFRNFAPGYNMLDLQAEKNRTIK